jgi:putative acetyltransferase
MSELTIRRIALEDNQAIAVIIRSTLKEFGANRPGTVYYDETTDHLYELFETTKSAYFIASLDGSIVGGAGVFPTKGLDDETCELVKMYLLPNSRGKGYASVLIDQCIKTAKEFGFKKIYLESMPELKTALSMYEKKGWKYLSHALGNSGHDGCGLWMLLEIAD